MTLLQCMLLFMCVGQVGCAGVRYGLLDYSVEIIPNAQNFLYSRSNGAIYLKHGNDEYEVLNFKIEDGKLVQTQINGKNLLPIYYSSQRSANRLGFILKKEQKKITTYQRYPIRKIINRTKTYRRHSIHISFSKNRFKWFRLLDFVTKEFK